jgi:phosphoglycolate phosphatase
VLWNIDLTLVDTARVMRAAYAEAFGVVAGRPLIQLPQTAGRSESEVFFDALALNGVDTRTDDVTERLLDSFSAELAAVLAAHRDDLVTHGRLLPGATEALAAVAKLDGVVQTVLTGNSKPNAMLKLRAFGLDGYVDFDIGGYGTEAYPRGTLLGVARQRTRPGSAGPGRWPWPAGAPAPRNSATRAPTPSSPTSRTPPVSSTSSRA